MNVLDVIRKSATKIEVGGSTAHTKSLLELLQPGHWSEERKKLVFIEAGFLWTITNRQILHFKHHANIRGNGIHHHGAFCRYVGDIPDFALDRAHRICNLGITYLTIHSMSPMPVERMYSDPVMVGWSGDPELREGNIGWIILSPVEGFIIAVWDNEKELEI